MPTRDGTLDDVVTLETEAHVPDAASFLGELRRILRIGWLEVLMALLADADLTTLRGDSGVTGGRPRWAQAGGRATLEP